MKKAFVVFTLTLALALALSAAFALSLTGSRDQVAVTAETLAGDPAAAEGLTAAQTVHYGYDLFWDLSIPLDRPEDAVVDFTYDHDFQDWAYRHPAADDFQVYGTGTTYHHASYNPGFSVDVIVGEIPNVLTPDPDHVLLADAIREVADRTPNGGAYAETVRLADYTDTYPLTINTWAFSGDQDYNQVFSDYFQFPAPADTQITVSITKDDQGLITDLFTVDPRGELGPRILAAEREDSLYFAFGPQGDLDFSNTPGGFGVYRMDMLPKENLPSTVPDVLSLETVCSLPDGAAVVDLTLSPDGGTLFITCFLNGEYSCLVLDTAAQTVTQTFTVPAPLPVREQVTAYDYFGMPYTYEATNWPITGALAGDNFLVLLGEEAADLHLYTLTDTGYTYAFSAPTPGHVLYLPRGHLTGVWTGEKLALGSVSSEFDHCTGLTLSVFEDGALTYQGEYSTSLNHLSYAPNNEAPPLYRTMDLLPGAALAFVP